MSKKTFSIILKALAIGILAFNLTACATATAQKPDPYMGYNQGMFRFNQDFNKVFLSPLTGLYTDVTPKFVRTGVTNFFENIENVPDMVNDILQGNWRYFFNDMGRFLTNSVLGLGGLIDVAQYGGMHAHQQSFGYTLYKWGIMRHSPYFFIPILGPATLRNALGFGVDYFVTNPVSFYHPEWQRYILRGIDILQKATNTLPRLKFITQSALNPYIAVRNAYLQNQQMVLRQIMSDGTKQGTPNHYPGSTYQPEPVVMTSGNTHKHVSPRNTFEHSHPIITVNHKHKLIAQTKLAS